MGMAGGGIRTLLRRRCFSIAACRLPADEILTCHEAVPGHAEPSWDSG